MAEKISGYTADATSDPIKDDDYLDLSNEDGGGGYDESKKILVSEMVTFLSANLDTYYTANGTTPASLQVAMTDTIHYDTSLFIIDKPNQVVNLCFGLLKADQTNGTINIKGVIDNTIRFSLRGLGNTDTTVALLVENSSAETIISGRDDKRVRIGNGSVFDATLNVRSANSDDIVRFKDTGNADQFRILNTGAMGFGGGTPGSVVKFTWSHFNEGFGQGMNMGFTGLVGSGMGISMDARSAAGGSSITGMFCTVESATGTLARAFYGLSNNTKGNDNYGGFFESGNGSRLSYGVFGSISSTAQASSIETAAVKGSNNATIGDNHYGGFFEYIGNKDNATVYGVRGRGVGTGDTQVSFGGHFVSANTGSGSTDVGVYAEGSTLAIDAVGSSTLTQSNASAALPVLTLDQVDVSEEYVSFLGTVGTGNSLEAVAAKTLTPTHFVKVKVEGGLTRYFEVGTIA